MASPLSYKKNYKVSPTLELFYTGGPVSLSSDGLLAACACSDEVKIVDVESGKVSGTLKGDTELVTALCWSRNGKSLFSASRSLQVRLWETDSYTCLRSWKAHTAPVASMALDCSGGFLATGGADRNVFVWDVDGGFCTHAFRGHKGVVMSVIFHPDSKRYLLFSAGEDGSIRVWDLLKKSCSQILSEHFSTITSLGISDDGSSLISAGRDKVVNVWDLQTYSRKTTVPVYETLEAVCVLGNDCRLPGSKKWRHGTGVLFLTVGDTGVLRFWNSETAQCVYKQQAISVLSSRPEEETSGGIIYAVVSAGERIMCVTSDQCLLFYEPCAGEEVGLRLVKRLIGYNEEIIDLKYVGDDANHLAVATNLERIRIYDIVSMACLQELVGHTKIVLSLDTCVDSLGRTLLVSAGKDGTARLWDVGNGACLGVAAGDEKAVGAIAFSKKKKNFFISGSSIGLIRLYVFDENIAKTQETEMLVSRAVASGHEKDINSIAVAPNDSLVCTASQDRTAKLFKLPELKPVMTFTGHKKGVWSVEFSPVDQCVLTGSGDKTIRIWSILDGTCLKTFEGHTASVLRASFVTRGTQVVSAGIEQCSRLEGYLDFLRPTEVALCADGLVKLWTIRNNECINTFDHHEDKIWALAVSGDGGKLVSGGADALVNVWEDCTSADEEAAQEQEENEALKDQDLANALRDTDYEKAVQLAFELKRPYRLLNVFEELFRKQDASTRSERVLKSLGKEHLRLLLEYIRDWNSKSKFCHVAQRVLHTLFHVISPNDLIKIPGIRDLLEGILPYSQRHFSRIDRLTRSTFILDFILLSTALLLPSEDQRLSPMETGLEPATPPRSGSAEPTVDANKVKSVELLEEVDVQLGLISEMKEHLNSVIRNAETIATVLSDKEKPKQKRRKQG